MAEPANPLLASCLCGAVQIAADPPIQNVGVCHCVNCRRAQGAGAWTWATFASAGWTGRGLVEISSAQDVVKAESFGRVVQGLLAMLIASVGLCVFALR